MTKMIERATEGQSPTCPDCQDPLAEHIGGRACVVGMSPAARRQKYVREQTAQRERRLR